MSSLSTQFERLRLTVNGFPFDALALGAKEGDLVLFLHGFPQFANAWTPVMQAVAEAGFRAVAVDQRGYSPGARPIAIQDYSTSQLVSDAVGFADALGARPFHLAAHDWGGYLAWKIAAENPERVLSLSVLSMPHPNAFADSLAADDHQRRRSAYITLFRAPNHLAEREMLANGAQRLRAAYRGHVADDVVRDNVRRLSEEGALTAALNWYRAVDLTARIGRVAVPTLFIWGSDDHALGESAARGTESFIDGRYRFEILQGKSHWLLDEAPDLCVPLLLEHLASTLIAAATRQMSTDR